MSLTRLTLITLALAAVAAPAFPQECVPGAAPTPEQQARRRAGLQATRTINNLEANQPGSAIRTYLRQADLASSPFAARATGASAEFIKRLNFTPGEEVMPGWQLTLDVTAEGYWFMLKDKTDPCGFAFVSNQSGLIFEAQPIR